MDAKLQKLAELISIQTRETFVHRGFSAAVHERSFEVQIKPGKKYTKVDVGASGKYMVDSEGNIFGIKAYGVIHTGKRYGTLDTIDQFYWGDYVAKPIK